MGLTKKIALPDGRQQAFQALYKQRLLGDHETISGIGSMLTITRNLRAGLMTLIECGFIQSMLDVGCGDFNWAAALDMRGIRYTGIDIVNELIEENRQRWAEPNIQFECMDIVETVPSPHRFVMCRDLFTHLSIEYIISAFNNIKKSGAEYFAATSYIPEDTNKKIRKEASEKLNIDMPSGYWRTVNLREAPFDFREPLFSVQESQPGKTLDIWALKDLPFITSNPEHDNPSTALDFRHYRFFNALCALPFIEKIELFGSRAVGRHRSDSDIDLLIYCTTETTRQDWLKVCDIVDAADTTLPIDCVRYQDNIHDIIYNLTSVNIYEHPHSS